MARTDPVSVLGGTAQFASIKVKVQDSEGIPIPSVTVTFDIGDHSNRTAVQITPFCDPKATAPVMGRELPN
jgi:hypothetical protein